jgi:hypothetical protein
VPGDSVDENGFGFGQEAELVRQYLSLGLRLDRHIHGVVDAYYGPPALRDQVAAEPRYVPQRLVQHAGAILTALDDPAESGMDDAVRRRWLRAQVLGLATVAAKLAGDEIGYADEVEACYGVRPQRVDEDLFAAAHARLDGALPGSGPLLDRYVAWREAQAVPPDKLDAAIRSLADDFRERTQRLFGLPDGEHIDFELVADQPWSGFNYYLGDLRSRVAINTDLPVLSTSLGHLVAHEAYPGHHTEHTRKEVGLVRRRRQFEESIFLVGTPQCLLAEGLADLGLEVIVGAEPEPVIAEHLRPLGIAYDAEVVAAVREAGDALNAVRGNVAWLLHEEHRPEDECVDYSMRWSLLSRDRARQRRLVAARGAPPRGRVRRLFDALVVALARPRREVAAVPDRRDLARLHLVLRRGAAAVPPLRRGRSGPLRAPPHRATDPRRPSRRRVTRPDFLGRGGAS